MAVHIRHAGRYREIAVALIRQGFGYMAEEMGLTRVLRMPTAWIRREAPENKTLGERIRLVMESLGPTFIKLGQLASTRADLLPASVVQELVKLQDEVPAFEAEEARRIVELELGGPLEEWMSEFSERPVAAASIGQVHTARLVSDGCKVAVKVQRPGVKRQVTRDLEILHDLVAMGEKRWEWVTRYQIPQLVDEFSRSMEAELDYTSEARNMERISAQFEEDEHIHVPDVFWDLTTERVLTMAYVEGVKPTDRQYLEQRGYDVKTIASRIVNAMLNQIFISGFFHADPHPGNLLLMKDGSITFLDFGMVGRLSSDMRDYLSSLVIALMRQDTPAMVRSIERMGMVPEETDLTALRRDLDRLRERYYDVPFSEVNLGQVINDFFSTAREHGIGIPPDLLLLGKALVTTEGMVERLDPTLSIVTLAEPFGRRLAKEKFGPDRLRRKTISSALGLADSLTGLPDRLRHLTSFISGGRIKVELEAPVLRQASRGVDRLVNRLAFSIVLLAFSIVMAGLVIGAALAQKETMIWNYPIIEIGVIVAVLMVALLLFSIFRSGRF
ncbi:AarF/ABC1/UbiB kinase family protein [Saccharibacillus sp. CPCC 101409]|uniref:ABC1 kinase family protein n=1 Tax=Saccharibacillus sp. CPCC 101409 TaxID=3058041 RepID=UPI0026730187|nr:AarF/ABC1/UbiB kinase family protein [Saccharibacillus sp. CPCC 101409]MDO3410149.1 AarF/ABC1/UbiB kinase family protein [Saccharibacillus sp. CPCC 101409]